MRISLARRVGLFVVAVALAAPLAPQPVHASPPVLRSVHVSPQTSGSLAPDVFEAVLTSEGRVMRKSAGLAVERVRVPAALRWLYPDSPDSLWKVTLSGQFPPRAERYVVLADESPIGFGVPGRFGHTVSTVTSDPGVLSAAITVRYGDAPVPPPAVGPAPSSAAKPVPSWGIAPDTIADPALPGPLAVTRAVYDFGDRVFQPSDLGGKVELTADVHYPTGLPGGPYPLVLFMHGNHYTCYKGDRAAYTWPCREGWTPLPNYAGYDYIASRLAGYGFIVVSVSANGVNVLGNYVNDTGMRQRGELLEKHIDLWKTWATIGGDPFGTTFIGKVDMSRIGTMGHSRGGEGVVYNNIVDQERPTPYGIDAVLALAPVDFTRQPINNVPFAVMLPYCDGDVSDLQGIHFFDDSRYLVPGDPTPKDTVTVFGANHNFFNTVWSPSGGYPGSFDDGDWVPCEGKLTAPQERHVGRSYIIGFFRRYLANETSLDPMWTGAAVPTDMGPAHTLVSYLAPDAVGRRLDVDRFTDPGASSTDQLGGAVTAGGMSMFGWCSDIWATPCVPGHLGWLDVHLSYPSWFDPSAATPPGLQQGLLGWPDHNGTVRFDIPADEGDVSGFDAFQFRAATNPGYWSNQPGDIQDLAVVLNDGSGHSASLNASDVGNDALAYPFGGGRYPSGHYILNQVRFPLDMFPGVDLTDIRSVELRFSRTEIGLIDVADLAFTSGV
jgi:hypothetical protein